MPESAKVAPGFRKSLPLASRLLKAAVKSAVVLMGVQSTGVGKIGGSGGGDTSDTGDDGGEGGAHRGDHTPAAAQVAGQRSAMITVPGGGVQSKPKPAASSTRSSGSDAQSEGKPPDKLAMTGKPPAQLVGIPVTAKKLKGDPGGSSQDGSAACAGRKAMGSSIMACVAGRKAVRSIMKAINMNMMKAGCWVGSDAR